MISFGKSSNPLIHTLQAALNHVSVNVMIAGPDRKIIYMNGAVVAFLREAEAEIRRDLPGFDVNKLIGTNIDVFHKVPAHQQRVLAEMTGPHKASIKVGGRHFDLAATPISDAKGTRLGTMVEWADAAQRLKVTSHEAESNAIGRSQAVIEFQMDGTILTANENFLHALDYTLDEIKGKHHSLFVDRAYSASPEYKQFWAKLNRGEFDQGEYCRIGKDGREVWIQASYNPILDEKGKPYKVVKFATDITSTKLKNAEYQGQIDAIGKAQAVIHFNLDGTVQWANENFCNALGYTLNEIQGKHHSLFVDPSFANSGEYRQFWDNLRAGRYQAAEYKRIGKNGREVWIQASYNPILDPSGKVFKVVKFATDVTQTVNRRKEGERIGSLVERNLEKIVKAVSTVNEQSAQAAAASEETATTVQTVAAAAEELSSSVGEISRSVTTSKASVDDAIQQTNLADQSTKQLTKNAEAMSSIVELIQKIASQINLLALNATIESARAGDAGKGFAVVASEVKNLARQVEQATDNISGEISGIQNISREVAGALDAIKQSVGTVQNSVTGVASAIEEQSAVTREISSNMQTASAAVAQINGGLQSILQSVDVANGYAVEGQEMYGKLRQETAA